MKQKRQGQPRQEEGSLQELLQQAASLAREKVASLSERLTGQASAPERPSAGRNEKARQRTGRPLSDIVAGLKKELSEGTPAGAPAPSRQEVAASQMDRAIHRAYYRDGGYRFFACTLRRYVQVSMEQENDLELLWAAVYNTNLRPMLRQLEKLERELEALQTGQEALPLENGALLEEMRAFAREAEDRRLSSTEGWTPEGYRQAARQYTEELTVRLLDRYQPPAGE